MEDIEAESPWHFHPEIEIVYSLKGKGTNHIGNYIGAIEEGELLMIGKNLPHTRIYDEECHSPISTVKPESITVKFREDFLGDEFFTRTGFDSIKKLFENAERGIKFRGKINSTIGERLKGNIGNSGVPALLEIISILNTLAQSAEFDFLNEAVIQEENHQDSQKVNRIFEFTETHFRQPIKLSEVARLINLTEAAFCRYFKTRTRKSYFQYLTEIRIANACRMLLEEDRDIAEIGYSIGFNNPSNFHKHFKKIVHITPKEYRKKGQIVLYN